MIAWLFKSGNRLLIEGLNDKGKTGDARWLTSASPGLTVEATIYDRDRNLLAGPVAYEYIAGTKGDWQALFPEDAPELVVGEDYTALVRIEGGGALTQTRWLTINVVMAGDEPS